VAELVDNEDSGEDNADAQLERRKVVVAVTKVKPCTGSGRRRAVVVRELQVRGVFTLENAFEFTGDAETQRRRDSKRLGHSPSLPMW
jgi:hypothetical protein